ncbi:penicillin-binding protein 2 [Geopsychrobacter electrodiphilus]|uniref:penicillin-binding protein 2 n=1 Tax=Geopsychrobacter electrodiphilus TaxID=225196 RepID=UPI00037B0C60|nr:penicillin-binding protein 2 [Geopsychrobacter electrodiphilus]
MGLDARWIELPAVQRRLLLFSVAAAGLFLLLALRLWYLQIISYDRYTEKSMRNRTRVLSLAPPRGPIYDRNGELLVGNRPSFTVSVMRQDVDDLPGLLQKLAGLLGVDIAVLRDRWEKGSRFPIYRPVPLAEDVPRDVMERVLEHSTELPGVLVEVVPVRDYLEKGSEAHLIGYLGEVTEKELSQDMFDDLQPGDVVGKIALEKTYEKYLRGQKGQRLVEVDVKGKLLKQLEVDPPRPGNKLFLTISREVQRAADQAFGDQSGAAVVLDVHTGDVLAMLSRPTFDPSLFVSGIEGDAWAQLLKDPRHPLQNKVLTGLYSPASTFKMIVALAALRGKVITKNHIVDCNGEFNLGEARYRCWKKAGHGRTNLKKALRESCDVWFYQVGLELGIDKLEETAHEFGLGAPVGFPLGGEKSGVIPSQSWKRQRFNQSWYAGETVITAIGQGYVLTTPIQLAVMTAALANHGDVLQPQVVRRVEDWNGTVLKEETPQVMHHIDIPEDAWNAVNQGLVAAVNEPHGTASAARMGNIEVAGKTGTSQVVRRRSDEEEAADRLDVPYRFRAHALFVAYAPADNPEIALAVVVEHGQHGGSAAGPIARAILESYFKGRGDVATTILEERP